MKISRIIAMCIAVMAICLGVTYRYVYNINNFKCTAQSRYRIIRNNSAYNFYITQTIQLYQDNTGFISFNGKVVSGGTTQSIGRKVLLRDGYLIDNHTLKYQNAGVRKLATDSIDDAAFQMLLNEVSGDDKTIIFERERIDNDAWLIGNPDAWVFTCVEY